MSKLIDYEGLEQFWANVEPKINERVKSVNNITPTNGNVTIPNFQGSTVNQPAVAGLVPSAPPQSEGFLCADGTWKTISASEIEIVIYE